jgi:hypothetical protein
MSTMAGMGTKRRLTSDYKLQANSIGEITDEFDALVRRITRREELKFRGAKLRPGPLLNALIYEFLRLPEEEAARRAREALARLESFLAEEGSQSAAGEGVGEAKQGGVFSGGDESDADDASKAAKKSKRKGA